MVVTLHVARYRADTVICDEDYGDSVNIIAEVIEPERKDRIEQVMSLSVTKTYG